MSDSELQFVAFSDLSQGLFTAVNPFQIPVGAASAVQNVVWVDGYVRARGGVAQAFTPLPDAFPIGHISMYTDYDAERSLMRISRDGTNWKVFRHNGSWNNLAVSGIPGASDVPPTSCNFKGSWWMTTGNGDMFRYDGTSLDSVNTLQTTARFKCFNKPKIVVAGDSRLFIADCHNANDGTGERIPYRVAWSDFLKGEVWGGGDGAGSSGYVDLAKDSAAITGLYFSNSNLLVFKSSSISLGFAAGPPKVYDFKEIVSGIGCVSHPTIKRYRQGILAWLGDDNVYIGGTSEPPQAIGDRIRPRLQETISLTDLSRARAVIDRLNHLYTIFLPIVSSDDTVKVAKFYTVNLRNGSWWENTFYLEDADITDAVEYRDAPWSTKLLLSDTRGRIFEFGFAYSTDDGTPFAASWTGGWVQSRSVTKTDQMSIQLIRAYAFRETPTKSLNLGVHLGQSLDRETYHDFGLQVFDGQSAVYKSSRPASGYIFRVNASVEDASEWPKLVDLGIGFMPLGHSQRR